MTTNNRDPAPSPMAIGIVRKISVHLMLLNKAEKKTGSAKMVRKLSRPTKDGADAPSHSQNAIATVSSPGIKMIVALIASAGNKNGTDESLKRNFTTETQSSQRDLHHKDTKNTKTKTPKILMQWRKEGER